MASLALNTIKILVIGPLQSGKSTISNFLAERAESPSNYRPTVGVRILEFEKQAPRNPKRPGQDKVLIELWDISGDSKYDRCWPMIQRGAHGIIFCYNADDQKQEAELESWVAAFPKKMGISSNMCICLAHHLTGKPIKTKSKPRFFFFLIEYVKLLKTIAKGLSNLQIYDTSVEEGASTILPAFDKFFNSLMMIIYEKQEKDENNLMREN